MATTLNHRVIGVLVEELFEDLELWYPLIRMREAGAQTRLIGTAITTYRGKHGLTADARTTAASVRADQLDALIIPGGYAPDRMRRNQPLLELVQEVAALKRPVAFICHAGWVPISAGIVSGRRVTSAPSIKDDLRNAGAAWEDEAVVVDDPLISSRHPGDLPAFCKALLAQLS